MQKIKIIAAIRMATGKPVSEVAKKYGYSKHTFYRVINNETKSPKIQGIIASLISKQVNEIWPELAKEGKKKSTSPGRSSGYVGRTK